MDERLYGLEDIVKKWIKSKAWSELDAAPPHRAFVMPEDDDGWLLLFPARTNKDLALRRTRFRDCQLASMELVGEAESVRRWERLSGCDYIAAMNITWAWCLLDGWWQVIDRMLEGKSFGYDNYVAATSWLSVFLKTHRVSLDRRIFCEGQMMVGYRNLPVADFDYDADVMKLAQGAPREFEPVEPSFNAVANELFAKLEAPFADVPDFPEYVKSGVWATSGSSSVGKVELEIDGKKAKFKMRKNMVYAMYDLDDLAATSEVCVDQINRVIVKSELGKVRLAVASNIEIYLQMVWILEHIAGAYLQIVGMTLQEDLFETFDRIAQMSIWTEESWCIPYDYQGFDRQPLTEELICIWLAYCAVGRRNAKNLNRYDAIVGRSALSFMRGVLVRGRESKMPGSIVQKRNGLDSGVAITSLLGISWNDVQTTRTVRMASALSLLTKVPNFRLRGDDSAIFCHTYLDGLAIKCGYNRLSVKAGDGKFSLGWRRMEFLRQWYEGGKVIGYACRVLPGLTQRKPWSSEPWDAAGYMKAINDNLGVLYRRGASRASCDVVWRVIARGWSLRLKLDVYLLSVPSTMGGFGVTPWDGVRAPAVAVPKVQSRFDLPPANQWYKAGLAAIAQKWSVTADMDKWSADRMQSMVVSDDVPQVARELRDNWRQQIVEYRPEWRYFDDRLSSASRYLIRCGKEVGALKNTVDLLLGSCLYFGKWKDLGVKWTELQELARYAELRPFQRLAFVEQDVITQLQKRGFSRGGAVDWLSGKTGVMWPARLHPGLIVLADAYLASMIDQERGRRVWIAAHTLVEPIVQFIEGSPVAQLFLW